MGSQVIQVKMGEVPVVEENIALRLVTEGGLFTVVQVVVEVGVSLLEEEREVQGD